ncbi:MAG: S9 family peptidase [Elusimicrobia bacterium]|nr:S9 family peptidase [Elusimicrobiota bacterium]
MISYDGTEFLRFGGITLHRKCGIYQCCLVVGWVASVGAGVVSQGAVEVPVTKREAVIDRLHGEEVADPYRWLEDGDSPQVQVWTDAQNRRTRFILDQLPGREVVSTRLQGFMSAGVLGDPEWRHGRLFYTKRQGAQNQPALYVRTPTADLHSVIDPNGLSPDGTVSLDWWEPSPNGTLVAYGLSQGGTENSTLHVRAVDTGTDLPDRIERTSDCSVSWMPDGRSFYYTRYPKPGTVPKGEEQYHRKVYFHRLGTDPETDPLIWGEGRAKEDWPEVTVSPEGRYLLITVWQGWSKSELVVLDLQHSLRAFKVSEGREAVYTGRITKDRLYIRTNAGAPRYRVSEVTLRSRQRGRWHDIIPESQRILQDFQVTRGYLALRELSDATSRIRLVTPDGEAGQEIPLPGVGTVSGLEGHPVSPLVHFRYQSFFTPTTLFVYRPSGKRLEVVDFTPMEFDPSTYQVRQVRYYSKDGTAIPMFIVSKRGGHGPSPTILTGYGGFNTSLEPRFQPQSLVWLERGGVYAVTNLRGGGEYGEAWHQAGMRDKKQNTFDDFIAAAEYLVREGITRPDLLALLGGSNGGLLVTAVMTQRPDLCKAVIGRAPLTDMLRYHRSLVGRLWIAEYGSAEDPPAYRWLKAYSPYHHVRRVAYPSVLLTIGKADTRVDPMHARKMTAALQWASRSSRPVLLRVEPKTGHGAGKPLDKEIQEWTDIYSFLFWQLQ